MIKLKKERNSLKSDVIKKRKPKQKRGIETKQRILAEAFKLFSEKGLHGTNSRQIAAASEVANGTFYSYYKDKREVFLEILKMHKINSAKILNEFSTQNSKNENTYESIRDLISKLWSSHDSFYEFDQKAAVLRKVDEEIDDILKKQEKQILEQIVLYIKRFGTRLRKKDLNLAGVIIMTTIREFMHSYNISDYEYDIEHVIDELTDMATRYLFK